MVRGRKPLPSALKLVKGERPDRVNDDEPQPEDGIPECPSEVHKVRAVWDYTVKQLTRMRVLTMADRDMLLAYCQAVVTHDLAVRAVARDGMVVQTSSGGLTTHPAIRIQRDAAAAMKSFGTEFGLTPASRTRIKVADQAPKQEGVQASRLLSG
jgi:P27 family predicted phage terminase small subunit